MNVIQIMGNLGADAETRFTASGQKVTNLRVATTVRKGGKEETVWYKVTLWGERYDKMLPYLKKGSSLIVVGELNKPEIYNDREGRPQISLEITAEFIRFSPFGKGSDKAASDGQQESMQGKYTTHAAASSMTSNSFSDSDDGLPF